MSPYTAITARYQRKSSAVSLVENTFSPASNRIVMSVSAAASTCTFTVAVAPPYSTVISHAPAVSLPRRAKPLIAFPPPITLPSLLIPVTVIYFAKSESVQLSYTVTGTISPFSFLAVRSIVAVISFGATAAAIMTTSVSGTPSVRAIRLFPPSSSAVCPCIKCRVHSLASSTLPNVPSA